MKKVLVSIQDLQTGDIITWLEDDHISRAYLILSEPMNVPVGSERYVSYALLTCDDRGKVWPFPMHKDETAWKLIEP